MKRHLPGLLVFTMIVGVSMAAYGLITSLSRTLDPRSVPPVIAVDEVPVPQPAKTTNYLTRLVQYDHKARRLTARLEVDRNAIGGRSTVEVTLAVDGSEAGFRSLYFRAVGKVLSGDGQSAIIVVDQTVPESLQLNPNANHYMRHSGSRKAKIR